MSHLIDYCVGKELYIQPIFSNSEGSTVTISKIEGDIILLEFTNLVVDRKTNRITSGYRQFVYDSKEQYEETIAAHRVLINNIKFMDNVEWREVDAYQFMQLLDIACPGSTEIKKEPFLWHELSPDQLNKMVYVIESTACG